MKRIALSLLVYIIVLTAVAQKPPVEIARDPKSLIPFESGSLLITTAGFKELKRLDSLFKKSYGSTRYEIMLMGSCSPIELKNDNFIRVKRCRVVIDSLEKKGIPIGTFKIKEEAEQETASIFGVRYFITEKCGVGQMSPKDEDQYFEKPKKSQSRKSKN